MGDFIFNAQNYNILIIEESKFISQILIDKLSEEGFNCLNAKTLEEANQLLKEKSIHYIIVDPNLSNGNGYELIVKLKDTSTQIFVLSELNDRTLQEQTYDDGVIEFIIKDNNFIEKIVAISKTIQRLEKNRNSNILIVDDSRVIREQLGELLQDKNYNTHFASTTEEAIKAVLTHDIDLILLDVQLHEESGIDFLEKYKAEIFLERNITVIVISGHVGRAIIRDGLKAGAVDVLKKPFVQEEIILKVNLWIDYKQKTKDILESTKLLSQYKETVDRSSIVAKTNKEGVITYVNDEFCKLTEFTKKELIGNTHNIIKHPKTPKIFYQKMWKRIKEEKKPWHNKIQNCSKKGKVYWVDTIINPILDKEGNVVEYIAISHDITTDQNMKEYFKKQINVSTENMEQAMKLSNEYQRAMNESSIVSRTDLKGYITFVNDEFCRISGFEESELIGENHNIIRHPDMHKDTFKEIWLTIKSGQTWKGIIKNRTKSGDIYWVDSTIVPIKDNQGKIVEYMGIRKDLTSLFSLHDEIEHTQKEIIYRMGEIGETRSKETGNHVKRVAHYSRLLAKYSNLEESQVDIIFTASPMHDIGKVGISDEILKKPGKLNEEEFKIMQEHALIGYNILQGSEREVLKAAAIVAKEHHEKWNGKGYPEGLKGEDIHIFGRITAIADVFDALGSDRCYKKAWDDERIFKLLKEEKGQHFDPRLIDIFFEHLDEFIAIRDKYKDII